MFISKFTRWSGLALLLAGVLTLSNLFHPNEADPNFLSNPAWIPVHILLPVGWVLGLFGFVGLYLRQAEKNGVLGTLGFILVFLSTALFAGPILILEAFIVPALARSDIAEAALSETGPVLSALPILFLMLWVFVLGSILLGISIIRAGVLPRLAGVLLIVGPPIWILFAEPPAPFIGYLIGGFLNSVAWIWLGYAVWEGSRIMAIEAKPAMAGGAEGL